MLRAALKFEVIMNKFLQYTYRIVMDEMFVFHLRLALLLWLALLAVDFLR